MIFKNEQYQDSQGNTYLIKKVKNGEVTYSVNGKGEHTVSETTIINLLDGRTKTHLSLTRVK